MRQYLEHAQGTAHPDNVHWHMSIVPRGLKTYSHGPEQTSLANAAVPDEQQPH